MHLYERQSSFHFLILRLHPANERRRYKVTPPLIRWAQVRWVIHHAKVTLLNEDLFWTSYFLWVFRPSICWPLRSWPPLFHQANKWWTLKTHRLFRMEKIISKSTSFKYFCHNISGMLLLPEYMSQWLIPSHWSRGQSSLFSSTWTNAFQWHLCPAWLKGWARVWQECVLGLCSLPNKSFCK